MTYPKFNLLTSFSLKIYTFITKKNFQKNKQLSKCKTITQRMEYSMLIMSYDTNYETNTIIMFVINLSLNSSHFQINRTQ